MWSWLDLLQLLNGIGLLILAAIFTVGFNGEDSRSAAPEHLRARGAPGGGQLAVPPV